jgi:CBS domain-containing protein
MITAKVMTDAVTVTPDTTLAEAARVMLAKQVGSVQVVDNAGRLVGMLTESDLLRQSPLSSDDGLHVSWLKAFLKDAPFTMDFSGAHNRLVRDVMSENPVSVEPEDQLAAVAEIMRRMKVKRLPVVQDGTLVGVVGIADLLDAITSQFAPATTH